MELQLAEKPICDKCKSSDQVKVAGPYWWCERCGLVPFESSSKDRLSPKYYSQKPIEPITFILANQIPYCEGNVIKYVVRWKEKGGVEDLRKAQRYIDFLIENEEAQSKG